MSDTNPELKQCTRCHSKLLLTYFGTNRQGELFKTCKNCRTKRNQYQNSPEGKLSQQKYRETHKEELALKKQEYDEKHKEKTLEYAREYRKHNYEKVRAYQKEWMEKHKDKYANEITELKQELEQELKLSDHFINSQPFFTLLMQKLKH